MHSSSFPCSAGDPKQRDLAGEPTIFSAAKITLGLGGPTLCGLEEARWAVAWSPVLHWHCRAEAERWRAATCNSKRCYSSFQGLPTEDGLALGGLGEIGGMCEALIRFSYGILGSHRRPSVSVCLCRGFAGICYAATEWTGEHFCGDAMLARLKSSSYSVGAAR